MQDNVFSNGWGWFYDWLLMWIYENLSNILPVDRFFNTLVDIRQNEMFQKGIQWLNWLFPLDYLLEVLVMFFNCLIIIYAAKVFLKHVRIL